MKQLFYLLLLIGIFASCGDDDQTNNEKSSSSYSNTTSYFDNDQSSGTDITEEPIAYSIDVVDEDGNSFEVTPAADEVVIAFGSWCPHSTNLLKALSAKEFSTLFDKEKIIFLLHNNEIEDFKNRIKASGEFTETQMQQYFDELDKIKEYSKVVDPTCLGKLSKFKYYYVDYNTLPINGIPDCYNPSTGNFEGNYMQPIADIYSNKDFDKTQAFIDYFENLEKQ